MEATTSAVGVCNPKAPIRYCVRCNESFADYENMACTGPDQYWHLSCFVCAQCFRPLNTNYQYYKFENRIYCERDFRTLFAPCCARCSQYITIGRFIRALNKCWHPNCFLCDQCGTPLADQGFLRHKDRSLCYTCHTVQKEASKNVHICNKCHSFIDDDDQLPPLRIGAETYHAYHFHCHSCGIQLRPNARQLNGDLYCLKCHDHMDIPICGACRRPIEERVVTALGKHWHAEHFACATCEKPFHGKRHFEVKGLAYCQSHYYELFGHKCCACNEAIQGAIVSALGKHYCNDHFACYYCGFHLVPDKTKFYDIDSNPCCKKCYRKFPPSLRKRQAERLKMEREAQKKFERDQMFTKDATNETNLGVTN